MNLWVGTSGYSYKEWKGTFYPDDVAAKDMLRAYATRLPSVEINNTFYRLPKAEVLEGWARQVPEGFRFAVKASRRITHMKRLNDAGSETEFLLRNLGLMGDRLGVVLYQLPPNLKKDLERLEGFLSILPDNRPAVFEFRHESWFEDDVFQTLREHGAAMCIAATDEDPEPDMHRTADFGYVRLRRLSYSDDELRDMLARINDQGWTDAYVYFKHEGPVGPDLAVRMLELA